MTRHELELRFKADVLRRFVEEHGWSAVVRGVRVSDIDLFHFAAHQRAQYRRDRIADYAVEALEAIPDWSWDPRRDRHRRTLDELRRFIRTHRWDQLSSQGGPRGEQLRMWCSNRRIEKRRGTIQPWLVPALEALPGWSWEPRDDQYDEWIRSLRDHVSRHGWDDVHHETRDRSGAALGTWVSWVRHQYQ